MAKVIQIAVLIIYIVTSSFTIGVNKWAHTPGSENQSYAEALFDLLTFPICDTTNDTTEEGSNIPLLIKDPTDENQLNTIHCYSMVSCADTPVFNHLHSGEKIKDPFRIIFSPPPQLL
ncbi:MAG TPA: hypothetical protein VIK89_15900 [Cytophagaceae bacterium]